MGFEIGRPGQVELFRRDCIQRLEAASLVATDRAARNGLSRIRAELPGRLGRALTAGSDLQKGRGVHRLPGGGFRTSGYIAIRSRSERAIGAIESATEGAEIRPVRSPWLWIATDEIPKRAGRFRMTPALYRRSGLEQRIGPLIEIPGRHRGESLLVVYNVTVDRFGRPGRARRAPSRGGIRGNRERRDMIVAFVGITRTSRTAVTDVPAVLSLERARIPDYRAAAMRRDGFVR